jgi:hypothetical protein
MGNLSIKKLRYALEAAGHGASGSPRHTFLRAHDTKGRRRQDRTAAPILIRSPVPAPAGMITFLTTTTSTVWFQICARVCLVQCGVPVSAWRWADIAGRVRTAEVLLPAIWPRLWQ